MAPPATVMRQVRLWDFGLILLVTLLLRLPALSISTFDTPSTWDEHAFLLAAREVMQGQLPYVTFWDHRPPGSPVLLASMMALVGPTVEAARWLAILAVAAAGCAVYGIAYYVLPNRVAAVGAALLWVVFSTRLGGMQLMTDTLQAPFTALAILLLLDASRSREMTSLRWYFGLAGLAVGIAVAVKYVPAVPVSLVSAAALLSLLRQGIGLGRCIMLGAVFSAGLLLPTLIAAGVYWRAGLFSEFWYANFGFALRYIGHIEHVRGAIMERARWSGLSFAQIWPLVGLSLAALLPGSWRPLPRSFTTLGVTLWLLGEVVALCLQTRFFNHQFLPLLAPMAILSAVTLQLFAQRLALPDRVHLASAVGLGFVALVPLVQSVIEVSTALFRQDVPRRIAAALPPGASVYVANYAPIIYLLAAAPLPTRHAYSPHLVGSSILVDDIHSERARLLAERPRYVVLHEAWRNNASTWDAGALHAVEAMLAAHYVSRESWPLHDARGQVTLYARRD